MIDFDTVKFIDFLNTLAFLSTQGIEPLSTAKENVQLAYDDSVVLDEDGIYPVVGAYMDFSSDLLDREGIAVFIDFLEDEDGKPCEILRVVSESVNVVIANGFWTVPVELEDVNMDSEK